MGLQKEPSEGKLSRVAASDSDTSASSATIDLSFIISNGLFEGLCKSHMSRPVKVVRIGLQRAEEGVGLATIETCVRACLHCSWTGAQCLQWLLNNHRQQNCTMTAYRQEWNMDNLSSPQ